MDTQEGRVEAVEDNNVADKGRPIFETDKPVRSYFPGQEFRDGQAEAIEAIENAYKQGYKFVILEAPTGSGKSFIAGAFANAVKDTHMLTIQKILQDQYQRDFPDYYVMKGRNAYNCLMEVGETCAKGPCQRDKRISCSDCPYKIARRQALEAKVTINNFDSFYYQNRLSIGYPPRTLMIVDEAHNIERKYLDFISFTISSKEDMTGIHIPEYDKLSEYAEFMQDYEVEVTKQLGWLTELYENGTLPKDQVAVMRKLQILQRKIRIFLRKHETVEYVFDYEDRGMVQKLTLRPVMVDDEIPNDLFVHSDFVLMMSATILDKELFCEGIGLDPEEVRMIQMGSQFPKKNRPIFKKYAGYMSYKHIHKTKPLMLSLVEMILEQYPERKGIIQTHTENIAEYIRTNIDDAFYDRLTFNKDYLTPMDMLEAHKNKPGSFIVASGLREGLDLKGDLSQIQIFCKVPYPSLADKQVKRRAEISQEWYGYITAHMLVQALGRSIRSKKDKALTFILDRSFDQFMFRNGYFIPDYIKEAIVGKSK
jgi:Rad3-related DNA helicase